MTKDEYFTFHAQFCERMSIITQRKSADYTGDSEDPFANFKVCEKLGICSTETGFLVRMLDKLVRVSNLADGREAAVFDERIEDTLFDTANYAILFAGYLKSKQLAKMDELIQVTRDVLGDDYDTLDSESWPTYEIQARNNRGQVITLESHMDPYTADSRMQQLESEWPTFTLTVVPVHDERS